MNWWKFAKKKAEEHTGVLVGLCLPSAAAKELAWSGEAFNLDKEPEEASDLHLSLAFLGSALELDRQHDAIVTALQHFADQFPPLKGVISGLGQFDGRNGGSSCVYASLDAPELPDMRHRLLKCLELPGVEVSKQHGFTPHITLQYLTENDSLPMMSATRGELEIEFKDITLFWAGKREHFPFQGDKGKSAPKPSPSP